MSLRDSQFGELKVPLTWTAAVALIVAAVIAVALLLTDRRETFRAEAYGAARGATDSVLAPVGDVLSAPGRWTGAGVDAVRGYFFAVSENRRLKGELRDMRQWRDVAYALKNENARYRSLLGLKTDPPIPMVAARIVVDSRGAFADTRIANTGREAGVRPGNPVMSEYGLVGRVIGVTNGASRVLMLTDVASRTPVMIDRTNARAILTGDGGPNPRLDYLRGQDPVREGDRILTSGDGGILPRGLPVGFAVKGLDGKWRVVLAADKGPIDFVRILLFQDFTQVIDRKDLDSLPVPPPTPGEPVTITAEATPETGAQPGASSPASVKPAAATASAVAGAKAAISATAVAAPKPPASVQPAGAPPFVTKPLASAAAKTVAPSTAKPVETKKPSSGTTGAAVTSAKPLAVKSPALKPATPKSPLAKPPVAKPPAAKASVAKPAATKSATKPAAAKPTIDDLVAGAAKPKHWTPVPEEPPH